MTAPDPERPSRDLREALAHADDTYQELNLPASVDARLRWRLAATLRAGREPAEPRPVRTTRRWAFAAAATALVAALILTRLPTSETAAALADAGPEALLFVGPMAIVAGGSTVTAAPDSSVFIAGGQAAVANDGFDGLIDAVGRAEIRHERGGLRLVRGRVTVSIRKAARASPVRLFVSHGAIEVLGTRFEVVQGEAGGEVTLFEGVIRFSDGARSRVLMPGQSLRWPLPVELAPAPGARATADGPVLPPAAKRISAPSAPTPDGSEPAALERLRPTPDVARSRTRRRRRASEGVALAALLDDIAGLRTRGEYEAAASALRRALTGRWRSATREQLSFELGSILGDHLGDRASACETWRGHQQRFANGRFAGEVRGAQRRLRCTDEGRP